MTTFLLSFGLLTLVMLGMALGVVFTGRRIQGSCGGINNLTGASRCVVCRRDADATSGCPKRGAAPSAQ